MRRTLEERFWSKVDDSGDCWLWTGAVNNKGYPQLRVEGKAVLAHRLSLQIVGTPAREEQVVMHLCDTPRCVFPGHLRAGTPKENAQDCLAKGRNPRSGVPSPLQGTAHPKAKLDEELVAQIRREYAQHKTTHRRLADKYGVSKTLVGNIIRRTTWKFLED